jgi:hypothetical protein
LFVCIEASELVELRVEVSLPAHLTLGLLIPNSGFVEDIVRLVMIVDEVYAFVEMTVALIDVDKMDAFGLLILP